MEDRLRKFARLVDAGGFTKASHELHISQPALSAAIAKLERELHAELLVRGSRVLRLTEAGKQAYMSAKELTDTTDNLRLRLAELVHGQAEACVGMIDSVASTLFSSSGDFGDFLESTRLSIVVNNSRYLAGAVERNELDAAFCTDLPLSKSGVLKATPVGLEPFVLVCHAADKPETDKAARLGRLPRFISYDQPSATYRIVNRALIQNGLTPEPIIYSTSPEVAVRLILLRKGLAALPYLLVKELLAEGRLALVGTSQPIIIERPINLLQRRARILPNALPAMAQMIEKMLGEYRTEAANLRKR